MYCQLNRKGHGFTLIEMILTIVIFSILSIVVGDLLLYSFKAYQTSTVINQLDIMGIYVLERIAQDLRQASSLTTLSSTSLTYVDQLGTTYTYSLSGNSVYRNGYQMFDSIGAISFSYYDGNGNITATPSLVDYVSISLKLVRDGIYSYFSTMVAMRGTY